MSRPDIIEVLREVMSSDPEDVEHKSLAHIPDFAYLDYLYDTPAISQRSAKPKRPSVNIERHYRVQELATQWGYCANTITAMFKDEAGVVKVSNSRPGKRLKVTLSIPESVVLRVQQRLSKDTFEPFLTRRNPLRVVRLRDLHTGMSK